MKTFYKGVDISKYNNINWSKVKKEELDFVIIRAGYGFRTVDPKFKENIEAAIKLGLHIGIYWFSYAGCANHAKSEAEFCLKTIEPYKKYIDFPVWFDWEADSKRYAQSEYRFALNKNTISNMAITFMETIKKAGYKTGNYSNLDYLNAYFNDTVKNNYDTWLAHVAADGGPRTSTSYSGKYTMWQYSWKGRPNGFYTDTDMNYCYVDYLAGSASEAPKVESKPATYQVPAGIKFRTDVNKNVITTYKLPSHAEYKLSDHFKVKEFQSKYSKEVKIHNKLIIILEALYKKLDCSKIIVNSGYRTPEHDKAVGGSGTGQHTLGRAADIVCYDKKNRIISAKKVCCALEDMGGIYGIGYISTNSTHVDTRDKSKKWWGDETKAGAPNISKLGYNSFHDYFKM